MKLSSEYVTLGHPDRLCDAIASELIDRIQKKDGADSHAAIEIFAADDTVIFGGEAKTSLKLNKKTLEDVLEKSFELCGYSQMRRESFSKDEVRLAKDTKIMNKIHAQSADIARATTDKKEKSGYNDQGIFFGAYDSMTPTGQGIAKFLAQEFGEFLFAFSKKRSNLGSDIKTTVTLDFADDNYTPLRITHVTVAIPTTLTQKAIHTSIIGFWDMFTEKLVAKYAKDYPIFKMLVESSLIDFTVNGTGRYVNHGYHADTSMTGRKLAVNNMSAGPIQSQCQCGGGSYIKPFHASDFLLPMVGNWIAKAVVDAGYSKYVNAALACTIGSTSVDSICITGDQDFEKSAKKLEIIKKLQELDLSPDAMAKRWGFPETFSLSVANSANFASDDSSLPWNNTKELLQLFC